MDRWKKGRREILDGVAKIYDKIQAEAENELQDDHTISISREEFQNLLERSTIADELEKKIATLRVPNHESEPTQDSARLAHEKAANNIQLTRESVNIAEDLTTCKIAQARVQKHAEGHNCTVPGSHKDGERSKQASQINQGPADGVLAPISTNVLLYSDRVDNGDSKYVTMEKYRALVSKYNLVFQNWTDIKVVRTQLETSLRTEKDKTKKYSLVCERLEKKLTRNRDKIQELEEKVRSLERGTDQIPRSMCVAEAASERAVVRAAEETGRDIISPDPACPAVIDEATATTKPTALLSVITTPHRVGRNLEDVNYQDDNFRFVTTSDSQMPPGKLSGLLMPSAEITIGVDRADPRIDISEPHDSGATASDLMLSSIHHVGDQAVSVKPESPDDIKPLHDTPIVIEERCIKKSKSRKSTEGAKKVKLETISSSPIGLAAFQGPGSHESIDLDDIGSKQMTPRKQRSVMQNLSRAVPYGSRSGRRATGQSVLGTESDSPTDSGLDDGHDSKEDAHLNGDGARAFSAPLSGSVTPVLPRTSARRTTKRRRLTSDLAIHELVEDGENLRAAEDPYNRSEALEPSDGRLMRLLEETTPTNRVSISGMLTANTLTTKDGSKHTPVSTTRRTMCRPNAAQGTPKRDTGIMELSESADSGGTPRRSPATRRNPSWPQVRGSNINVEKKPLRWRPLEELSLSDFKVNPEFNHGYDYAFTEVVRNKDARRCLPGCTKPECCGNVFRALAEAAWDPDKVPTASQDEADTRMLKEFLGDNAHKILNMTKAEQDETLLQAKTRELANKHGKHRHAYNRRQSPPGFWRLDFPSTQEERDDRQKIERHERDLVAQRYNEAMRPGGAYVFRDE